MTIMERLRAAFTPIVQERALTPQAIFGAGWDDILGAESSAGQSVTAETAMRAAIGACIGLLADDISTQPLDAFRKTSDGRVPIDLPSFLAAPGGRRFDTSESYISDWVMSYGTDGNAFTFAQPNTFEPDRLIVLDPQSVDVDERNGQIVYTVENDEVRGEFSDRNIIHVPGRRIPGQLRGVNPVQALKHSIGVELAAQKWEGAFFREGGTLGGIIMVPGGPETVNANDLRDQFQARHKGEQHWWKPAVLTGGATYDSDRINPGEAELEALWAHALEVAMRWFHIPPHLMSVIDTGAAARSSVEERGIGYVRHAVRPITTRFESAHSRLLGTDEYVKLNMNALMRGDAKARGEFYQIMTGIKAMKPDYVAALEDLPPGQAIEGWLETPNNNGIPDRSGSEAESTRALAEPTSITLHDAPINVNAAPMNVQAAPTAIESAVHVDSVRISDEAARQMVENSQAGFEVLARAIEVSDEENRTTLLKAWAQYAQETAQREEVEREERARLEAKVDKLMEPDPESYTVLSRDSLGRPTLIRQTQGSRSVEKRITRDASGHVISIVAA